MNESDIVAIFSRKLVPFVFLFGLYLISFGHVSAGGGFQGGAVLASAVILLMLSRGPSQTERYFQPRLIKATEAITFSMFILLGLVGMFMGRHFLGNFLNGVQLVFLLNMVVGIKVGAGIVLIGFHIFKDI